MKGMVSQFQACYFGSLTVSLVINKVFNLVSTWAQQEVITIFGEWLVIADFVFPYIGASATTVLLGAGDRHQHGEIRL